MLKNTITRTKNTKSVKQSQVFTYRPKTFENPNIVDIKLVITELQINYVREAEKIGCNSSSYSDTKKVKIV